MFKVIKTGMYSSIQDQGRYGYRDIGVPISGVMDKFSADLANNLLGNKMDAAVLEITMTGPKLKIIEDTSIVITGADISPSINDKVISNNKVYTLQKNDVLAFGLLKTGLRAYLAVSGGFKIKTTLGSQSFYKPLTDVNTIKKGSVLDVNTPLNSVLGNTTYSKLKPNKFTDTSLGVFRGPEFTALNLQQQELLFTTVFSVSNLYNRMAYQIKPNLKHNLSSILTSPVLPGTVQLTPSGQLIILMRDCQTTGGYPRVLQLNVEAINSLSQKKQNDLFLFRLVEF